MSRTTKTPTLGSFLKNARVDSGLSQKQVADRLGYNTPQFVSNWERGLSTPPGYTLRKLADIYDISPERLYNVLLNFVLKKTEAALRKDFFSSKKRSG